MKFKKLVAVFLAASMLFSFAACDKKPSGGIDPAPGPGPGPEIDNPPVPELHIELSDWPVIDGALAMIPYYEEMAARILGMPIDEARKHVLTNNTPQAYKNLAEGTVDMVFCAPPSDEQNKYCKQNGVELDSVQVLNSGFVFFVNKKNPVDSLSKQQLKDIYAGKITNWKEVGGKDEPIIAYQRGEGSGSQTGLYEHVISQDQVMDPPTELRVSDMAGIIDAVASYDNASGALGFSYYYYVTQMHYQDDVKLIAVDNIYPTAETITSDMYPFISKTSVFFNKNAAEDSAVRKIAEWCHGLGGDQLAKDLGYVPSGDKPAVIEGYGTAVKNMEPQFVAYENSFPYEIVWVADEYNGHHEEYVYSGLKNKAITDRINKDIREAFDTFLDEGYIPPYRNISRLKGVDYEYCSFWINQFGSFNNILSLSVVMNKFYYYDEIYDHVTDIITLNYDLNTGRRLKLGDLFTDKENGFKFLNTKVYDEINHDLSAYEGGLNEFGACDPTPVCLAAPFTGIKEDQKFTINGAGSISLYFDYNTPEFFITGEPLTITVPANDYTDFSRFASKQSLFEDESLAPYLLYQSDENNMVRIQMESKDYEELKLDTDIYVYASHSYYNDMTDYQKSVAMGDRDNFVYHVNELDSQIKQLKADGFDGAGGYINYSTWSDEIGAFVTIYENLTSSMYAPGLYENTYNESQKLYSFKAGSDEELILYDIFKENADIKNILINAFNASLKDNVDGAAILDYPGSQAFISAAVDNIRGFAICDNMLRFQYDDAEALVARFLPEIAEDFRTYIASFLLFVQYKYIGYDNLRIFE